MFRDELLNKEEVMKDFFRGVKEEPGYPHLSFGGSAMKYMSEVLGLKFDITENTRSQ